MKCGITVVVLTCILSSHQRVSSQVLHTENFNVVIDTSKVFKGNSTPSFRYRNLKEDFLEISNTADVSVRIGNQAFTVANRLEYSILGDKDILSGGYLYLEYVTIQNKKIALEPFFQMHWRDPRGLNRKYAGGANLRWRPIVKTTACLFFGIGSLYEFERWIYSGVPDSLLPIDQTPIAVNRFRGNSYVSFKHQISDLFDLDISAYYQPHLSSPFSSYRLASSFELTYNFTQYLGLRLLYQNIYDSSPVVPIEKWFHDLNFGLTISF